MTNHIVTDTEDREIISSRRLNASRETVYKAWTDPKHLSKWWGPKGFTNTFNEYDLRPGGKWSFVMHDENGPSYPNECVFLKIEEPRLLLWDHISPPKFKIQATFETLPNDETAVTFKMIFDTPEEADKLRDFCLVKNEENFDRLEAELKLITSS